MTFHDELVLTIAQWNKDPIEDEWLFERFRDRAINHMLPAEAFEAIGNTVLVLLEQADESTATEIMQTLIALARHSNTTEVHKSVLKHASDMVRQFAQYGEYARGKLDEFLRFYRSPI
jgi:hypothetical protein